METYRERAFDVQAPPQPDDKGRRGTRVMELAIGDIVHVNGQPHQILRHIGKKMLMRPISQREMAVAERLAAVRERMAAAGGNGGRR